ncbi:MAG: hypothetical protein ACR2QC_10210 [Gammaproteobacteria bacterium]
MNFFRNFRHFRLSPRPIPAKAGISAAAKRREIVQLPPSAWRFLPSQEWDGLFSLKRFRLSPEWRCFLSFADNTEFGGIQKYKKTAIPAKAGISLRVSENGGFAFGE